MIKGNQSGTTDLTGVSRDHSSGTINTPIRVKLKPMGSFKDYNSFIPRSAEGKGPSLTVYQTQFCNICGKLASETKTKRLVRDHNHSTRLIRGMLCDSCNNYIGIYESKKDYAPAIIKARKKKMYVYWLNTYQNRITFHLSCNTGIIYRCRKK